ncbi:MAG: hypothetical protein KC506_01670 [Nanoarchaeota archaeon]|nr:hypothetical protein [Nanoarchaeota archaeon]
MKKGYKHKTGVFGTDAEMYQAQLLQMLKNPNGWCRPDLISINGRYKPKLSLEVKSGRKQKGVIVAHQLGYAVNTEEDYKRVFNEDLPGMPETLPGGDWKKLPPGEVAYYYCLINRVDEIKSDDLDRPWAQIKLRWGDQYIAHHEYGFHAFAVAKARRTKNKLENVIKDLREEMKTDVLENCSHYLSRNKDPQSWQDFHGRDVLAIWHDDPDQATKEGKERIKMIGDVYDLGSLEKIIIPGPNKTNFYILSDPKHKGLFDKQFRGTVEERIPIIERVTRARRFGESLLLKMNSVPENSLFSQEGMPEDYRFTGLSIGEIKLLQRVSRWLDRGEEELKAEGEEEFYKSDEEDTEIEGVPF